MINKRLCTTAILAISIVFFSSKAFTSVVDVSINWGAKIGYGFASAFVRNHNSVSPNFFGNSFVSGGLFIHFSHVEYVRLQFEILYIRRGFKRSGYIAKLEGLSFPLLVRFQIPYGIYFNSGFGIGYTFKGEVNDANSTSNNIDDYFETLEYDLIAGMGWQFNIYREHKLFIEARFIYSLNNISIRDPESVNNYALHFYFGFQY